MMNLHRKHIILFEKVVSIDRACRYVLVVCFCIISILHSRSQTSITDKKRIETELEMKVEAEYRYFFNESKFSNQYDHFPSLSAQPEFGATWDDGNQKLKAIAFFRLDRDENRTHADLRELYYLKSKNRWTASIGFKKLYWGVIESNHLVDIINQTDAVESFDGEKKLGQPMLQFTYITKKMGTIDAIYMPYHRKRAFNGEHGRLRFGTVLDKDDLSYESDAEEWHQNFALRWKHYVGIVDIGLSHFYGNGREPLFEVDQTGNINAFYPIINQSGLDLQITHSAFLWKLESIYRHAKAQDFFAAAAGVEYTFSNIDHNGLDIGLLVEYLYDERDELALTGLQNDLFFGSRIAFNDINDTSILIGGIADLDKSSKIFSLEASRRFGSNWTAEIEARLFSDIDDDEFILLNFAEDSFLRLAIARFF